MTDGDLIALLGPAGWLLATPPHPAQQPPDVAGVVAHATNALNHPRDAGQRPQFRGIAMRRRTAEQRGLDGGQLGSVQTGFASRPARRPQAGTAPLLPVGIPAAGGLTTDLTGANHVGLRTSLFQQGGGRHAASFQPRKITPGTRGSSHTPNKAPNDKNVTILYETQ